MVRQLVPLPGRGLSLEVDVLASKRTRKNAPSSHIRICGCALNVSALIIPWGPNLPTATPSAKPLNTHHAYLFTCWSRSCGRRCSR